MDSGALRNLIESGKNAAEYAPLVKAGDDVGLAAALNRPRDGISVSRGILSHDAFIGRMAPVIAQVILIDQADPAKEPRQPAAHYWLQVYTLLVSTLGSFDTADPTLQGLLGQVEAAGLIDAETIAAITTRPGSDVEGAFGAGAAVSPDDVAELYAGDRKGIYEAAQAALKERAAKLMDDPRVKAAVNANEAYHVALMLADQELNGADWGIA